MVQLNLLPDLKKEFVKSQKTKGLVISASIIITLVALALSALLFIYVTFLQQVQINLATDDIKRKTQQLRDVKDIDKYLTIQNQLAALPNLHNQKGSYARLFNFLTVLNPSQPNNVNLSSLQILEADKTIQFSGTTSNFETLNVFVDTLKNADVTYAPAGGQAATEKLFSQALVQSADLSRTTTGTAVAFVVRTTYNPAAFDVRNSDVNVKVPIITTTQSVTQSPQPQQLFNAQPQGDQ